MFSALGGGVLAEQGALGAAQNFDAFDVHQLGEGHALARLVDAIDVGADAAFQAIVVGGRTEAAQAEAGVAGVVAGHDQSGHALLDVLQPVQAGLVQLLAVEDVDRDRHVLRVFFATASGDGGCVEREGAGRLLFRLGRHPGQRAKAAEQEQPITQTRHARTPEPSRDAPCPGKPAF